jgi:hypothetical protein
MKSNPSRAAEAVRQSIRRDEARAAALVELVRHTEELRRDSACLPLEELRQIGAALARGNAAQVAVCSIGERLFAAVGITPLGECPDPQAPRNGLL